MTIRSLVLGSGIVGRAAVWDLSRRGHRVTVADLDGAAARACADEFGVEWSQIDATDDAAVAAAFTAVDNVVSAVPYFLGRPLAKAAVEHGCNYLDFGGNPTVVKEQLRLNDAARAAGIAVVPDCGLAPGLANVMASGMIESMVEADDAQIRVGVLPQHPRGALQYQLAFYPGGLINEYAEPCEILDNGVETTVEPLTRFETLEWDGIGTLEAFSTAGGTSTMCPAYAGQVKTLEYKTLRFPGHGIIFAAMREIGLFDSSVDKGVSPRAILEKRLSENLPSGGPDMSLVAVTVSGGGLSVEQRILDRHDGLFSSLARMTAYPATALCDLIARGEVAFTGAAAMHSAAPANQLLEELEPVGIRVKQSTIGPQSDELGH